jgi:[acyl-carrier-protein] S-malonyltransferase
MVFDMADRALGFSLSELCFNGPEEELKLTANTQPAILAVSIACYRTLEEAGLTPDFVAGHSLGEYSALVAAGALNLEEAVITVRRRGQYMQEAVDVGVGAMAAILGAKRELVEEVCREVAHDQVCSPANFNSPQQIVIAGHKQAVERAAEQLRARGARRAIMLQVSAPFHCELMKPAEERLTSDLRQLHVGDLRFPLVTNVDAEVIRSAGQARDALERQVSRPVRWEESVTKLIAEGVSTFVEVGPGRVLTGLVRQVDNSVRALNVEDAASLEEALKALGK